MSYSSGVLGQKNSWVLLLLYLAMRNMHFFAQVFEGKIRMHIIHG